MSEEKPTKIDRVPRGGVPPKLNLAEAGDIITSLYERAGSTATLDELSEILGNSLKSSDFGKKVNVLKKYDLIIVEADKIRLSPSAVLLVAPEDQVERAEALKYTFLRHEPFDKIYTKYVGRLLPEDTFLKNSFLEFGGKELAEEWAASFKTSAEYAGLLTDRGDGKFQVRETGKATITKPTESIDAGAGQHDYYSVPTIEPVPEIAAPPQKMAQAKSDYQFLIEILGADMSPEEQQAVWTLIQYLKKKESESQ